MSAIVAEGSGVAVSPATTETIEAIAKATIGKTETEGATAKDIATILKLDKSAARRRLLAACRDDYVVNLEQRRGMPGKYRTSGQKVEPVAILPTAADLAEHFAHTYLSPKPVPPCHWDEIDEIFQSDNGGKPHLPPHTTDATDGTGGAPVAGSVATDKSLDVNGKSSPVAGWHGFPGDIDPREDFPPVCVHCGGPAAANSPVLPCAINGEEYLLHPACRADWLTEKL
jgi:hypothetical protein